METPPPRQIMKWFAYALAVATPGSLLVLPLWLLHRRYTSRTAWLDRSARRAAADAAKP